MRFYEIKRAEISVQETIAKEIRKIAFNNIDNKSLSKEEREEIFKGQKKFIELLKNEMREDGVLKDLTEYKDKKMSVIPSQLCERDFLLVFFDIDSDNTISTIKMDKEKNLLYLEKEEIDK